MTRKFSVGVLISLCTFAVLANFVSESTTASVASDRLQFANETPVGDLTGVFPETGDVDVIIELKDAPTARVYAQNVGNEKKADAGAKERGKSAARAQFAKIDVAQKRVLAHLRGLGKHKVLYAVQSAYNGIAATVDAADIDKIKGHADVEAVHALPIHRIENSTSIPFISAVNAWVAAGGNAGDGISIGIIDTGVDYTHAAFGGPGTAAAFTGNNSNIVEAGTFPTAKVVGGYDFAGNAYTGSNAAVPDPDPLDCNGHGSHVAGSAAGLGVTATGATYAGPYDATTAFAPLRIGPGVAPKASLYALKVFGCTGSTGLTTQAINWAVDPNGDGDPSDHLDVINMSLGSNFGTATDASATASTNASLAGVVVVAASGNAGDTTYITSSPASSTRAISVANIVDSGITSTSLTINSPAVVAGPKAALPAAFNPPVPPTATFTGNVKLANDGSTDPFPPPTTPPAVGTTADACQAFPPGFFAGMIALTERGGGCGFIVKVKNAQDAGAIAVIVANNTSGTISMGGADPTIVIPSVSITQADGNAIRAQLAGGVNATLQFPSAGDTVSGSSSRGPRRAGGAVKPEISAPGSSITSAGVGTGNGPLTISGTSMATPHVAGAMAVLRQLHPTWSVEELKALVMNTANHDLFAGVNLTGAKHSTARIGAGRIDLKDASAADVVVYSNDDAGAVSISFGVVEVVGTATEIRTARVVNRGSSTAAYSLGYVPLADTPGVQYSFPGGSNIVVPAGGETTFAIQLNATAGSMKHVRDATMAATQGGNARHYMTEESGYVTLTPASGTPLRLPVHAAARPASNMAAPGYVLLTAPIGATTIPLSGQHVDTGALYPVDELSVVSAFELQELSPINTASSSLARNADLKAVGVTSDYPATNSITANTRIFFAIATHAGWSSPSDVGFTITIDRDMNGTDDFQVVNAAPADANGNPFDVFVSARRPAPFTGTLALDSFINNVSPASLNTVVYDTNVMVIPVTASALGLTTANAKFRYRVSTTSRGFGGTIDSTGIKTFDAARPGYDFSGGVPGMPLYIDRGGSAIPVRYNKANLAANGALGALLLHHHNAFGSHDQTVVAQEPAATSVAVDAASGVYSDGVTLKATVSPASYLDQTLSGSVQFSVNGTAAGAPVAVGANGVATSTYTISVPAGSHSVSAAFTSSNAAFLSSSGNGTLTVNRESATASAAASNASAVKVNAAGGTAGPVSLCFDLAEVADASPGNTANINSMTVTLTPIGGGASVQTSAASFSGGGVGATRSGCVSFSNLAVNVYDVAATIGGDYYQGAGQAVLTVYDPSLGFVTGGGTIVRNGYKANFGVNIKYQKNGNAQGSLLYIEHRPDGNVKLKSSALGALAIVGGEANATGKANVNDVGNYSFIARIIDGGDAGDRFGLRVLDRDGAVVADLTFDPVALAGGNIQVPHD